VAPDALGHGANEGRPDDVSREAHVADAVAVIEGEQLAPAVVVGQSLGGITAMLLAARHPELVHALVVIEASPAGGDPELEKFVAEVAARLHRWPVPFATRAAAVEFFGGEDSAAAPVWAHGLEQRADGLYPRFDVEILAETLRQALANEHWQDWERIRCPTLIVRGEHGTLDPQIATEMLERLPHARLVEIAGAGHDVHLERPSEWRAALQAFLV